MSGRLGIWEQDAYETETDAQGAEYKRPPVLRMSRNDVYQTYAELPYAKCIIPA